MNRPLITIFVLLFLSYPAGSAPAGGDDIVVVSLKEREINFSRTTLRKIYLKRKILWDDNTRIVPVNLPTGNQLRITFTDRILELGHRDLVNYWNEQHFKGVRPPDVVESEEAVKIFVRQVEGAIGYISSGSLEPDLKILYRIKEDL